MPSGILNIAEWSPDQVAEWMSGLAPAVAQYVPALKERGLNGAKLLTLRCDDLEYLGIHIIGHQELLLEAVEHLRNFQYELSRECVQQLALRVSAAAAALARALRHHADARLETHSLADVARTVHAVKPLVCWLDQWSLCSGGPLAERKAALLKLSLEAATCAQRDRFAEQPARAVAAAAAAAAAVADYIIQEVSDPLILQPASLDAVALAQGERALGFTVLQSFCGHQQLARVRFGSPAHASGRVHEGDEIVQVGGRCVIGWGGEAVERACVAAARATGELALRLRRRGARALPAPPLHARPAPRTRLRAAVPMQMHALHRYELDFPCVERGPRAMVRAPDLTEREEEAAEDAGGTGGEAGAAGAGGAGDAASSSDESEALSPPASPTHLHLDRARMYPPKPAAAARRRHSVCGGSPVSRRAALSVPQFWQELQQRRWDRDGTPENDDSALYRRDKAVSCSTGLQLSPRPRTVLGGVLSGAACGVPARSPSPRGKLDKSHSTPAYDFDPDPAPPPPHPPQPLTSQPIPESPTSSAEPASPDLEKAGQIRDFKNSSCRLEEALLSRRARRTDDSTPEDVTADSTDVLEAVSPDVTQHDDMSTSVQVSITIDDDFPAIDEDCPELVETINPVLVPDTHSTPDSESSLVSPKIVIDEVNVDEAKITPIRFPKPRLADRWAPPDVPPEPPPRPPATQRPHPREHVFSPFRDHPRDSRDSREQVQSPISREFSRDFSPVTSPTRDPLGRDYPGLESPREAMSPGREAPQYPVLRMVPRPQNEARELTPLKPIRPGNNTVISVPLRHITKHDIKVIANAWREMPALNGEPERRDELSSSEPALPLLDVLHPPRAPAAPAALSPTGGGVRGIFPTSKSRSLKKKNSILAKRRDISARALAARGAVGGAALCPGGTEGEGSVWQRVRARSAQQPRWARRHLLLAHNLLYAYKTPECSRADCMIHLEGFTVCAAGEVRSRAHAFKVYHTGTAFYFATASRDLMLAWIQLIHRATMMHEPRQVELSKQFSETDYSDTESDTDSTDRKSEKEKDREKDRDKDKSKFGSLKKLTHRMQRSESQENVSHSSTSLDRKYLRFFSRNKSKDEAKAKIKQSGVPVPTEHYRSYRRVARDAPTPSSPPPPAPASPPPPAPASPPAPRLQPQRASKRIPKPINYIHASNPNLLDFEKSDFIAKPTFNIPKPKVRQVENLTGFVTLEEFMLKKQEEERRQVYTNRVLMGVERGEREERGEEARELQRRLARVVPDVIYGQLPEPAPQATPAPAADKPISVKGSDGYEKIVYPEERNTDWRDSLRRNDKVHSGVSSPSHGSSPGESGVAGAGGVSRLRQMFASRKQVQESGRAAQYPHLVCPPTFQPETYSLARLAPAPHSPHAPPPAPRPRARPPPS